MAAPCTDFALSSQAAAIAIVVFFFSIGFLFGYVWTRLYFEGDLARAANQLWNKVLQLKVEKDVTNLSLEADALRNEGHLEEALKTVDRALEQNAADAFAVFTKARILKALAQKSGNPVDAGKMNEALVYARRAAELMPRKPEPIYNIACYQALLGVNKREVLSNLAQAIEINPALRAIAKDDPDFSSLAQDVDFRKLTSPEPSATA